MGGWGARTWQLVWTLLRDPTHCPETYIDTHCNLFEKFVKDIQLHNLRSGKQEHWIEKSASTSNNTKQLPQDAQTQGVQMHAMTPSTTAYSSSSIQYNENAPNLFADDIPIDCYNTQGSSTNINTVYPIEVIQLPRGQRDIPISDPLENPVQKADRRSVSHNLIPISTKISTRAGTSSQNLQEAHLSSVPCPEIRPEGIREKQQETINNSSATVKSSTSQEKCYNQWCQEEKI